MSLNKLAVEARVNSLRWFPQQMDWDMATTLCHYALGVGGEAGEVCEVIKKYTTYRPDQANRRDLSEAGGEIVDCMTYLLALAGFLGLDLDSAWEANIAKCEERWGEQ